jgi:serine/threonine protein kinase
MDDSFSYTEAAVKVGIVTGPLIGEGSYGAVFQDIDDSTRLVKLQKLYSDTATRAFDQECRLARRFGRLLLAPAVYQTSVYTLDDDIDLAMIVMHKFEMSLADYLDADGDTSLLVPHIRQLLRRLANHGVVCVDIKPSNMVVNTHEGKVTDLRLIDFGGEMCLEDTGLDKQAVYVLLMLIYMTNTHDHTMFKRGVTRVLTSYPTVLNDVIGFMRNSRLFGIITHRAHWDVFEIENALNQWVADKRRS